MAELSFGQREVLGPVKTLLGGVTVLRMPMQRADYLHMMLDTHELVFSEGIATERFFTEAVTLEVLSPRRWLNCMRFSLICKSRSKF